MAAYHSPLRSKNSALRTNPTGRRSQRTGRTSFLNSAGIRTPPSSNLICFPLSPQTGSTRLLTCLHFLFFWYLAIKLFAITHGSSLEYLLEDSIRRANIRPRRLALSLLRHAVRDEENREP